VITGTVLRAHGGVYEVETEGGVVDARLRGRLKRDERSGDRVVAGDRVEMVETEGGWTVESVEERRSVLLRKAPGKAPRPKPIIANVDQVLVVFAAARPEPHLRMLDRFLVLCEASELEAAIVINKVELVGLEAASERFSVYSEIGYPVLFTSTKAPLGIESLGDRLCGATSVLTGPSGVGKSSLLNTIQPGLGLRVAAISEAVLKGRHTTVTAQLIPLDCGGYVGDTPGLRELGLWGIEPDELDWCFPEMRPFLGDCRYGSSCTHSHEPGCAVKQAAESGAIHPHRFDSYRRLLEGEEEDA
jgi:ribosome biogenesis GTPase / thiamine phosphate phosphatase